jgi:hypothetical protein
MTAGEAHLARPGVPRLLRTLLGEHLETRRTNSQKNEDCRIRRFPRRGFRRKSCETML